MEYLILSFVFLALAIELVLIWRKWVRDNRSERTAYYKVRSHEDSSIDDGWWVVIIMTFFLLGAADTD